MSLRTLPLTPFLRAWTVGAALATLFTAAALPPAASDDVPSVIVHADQPNGRFMAERFTNISLEAVHGQTTAPLADPAFAWVRATNALANVRCYNWLGDGIPKAHPNWFSGCRVVRTGPTGQPEYRWESLERVLDALIVSGVKPWIVCGGVPDALAAGPVRRNESGMATNHPKDYAQYGEMITQMVRRLEKTYGADEVRSWHFEVWSQPDHEGSWEGGRAAPFSGEAPAEAEAAFNRLYDHFASAALSVDEKLHIGGPGLAGDRAFLSRFLEHCARGKNEVTGKPGTRLDFISWAKYGSVAETVGWNRDLRETIRKEYPELAASELVLCESGLPPTAGEQSNRVEEAARLAALADRNLQSGGVDFLFRSGDLVDDHLNGYRPLLTRLGDSSVPLPAFRLYMLLSKMGGERLKTEGPEGVGVIAAHPAAKAQRNATQVLIYRYNPGRTDPDPKTYRLRIAGLPTDLLRMPMRTYRIDAEAGASYESWLAAGKPMPAPVELGKKLVGDTPFAPALENPGFPLTGGEGTLDIRLPANGVALITLGAEPSYGKEVTARAKRLKKAEEAYGLAVEQVQIGNLPKAVDSLRTVIEKYADTSWRETALYGLVRLYESDLRSPAQAEATRRELLTLPLDDMARLPLLERLRLDSIRKGDKAQLDEITGRIRAAEARLAEQRQWPLHRYYGE